MIPSTLPRLALRQSRLAIQRRSASTTEAAKETASNTTSKAKESASQATSQAQQGLSRVTSSASSVAGKATDAAGNAVAGASGRVGSAINFVQSMIPPTLYYARVVGELGKIIYRQRSMQPPNMQTIQTYMEPVTKAIRNPSSLASQGAKQAEGTAQQAVNNPEGMLERLRSFDSATMIAVGVVAAETIGLLTVGEMIGRLKIIGYRGGESQHH